MADVQTLPPPAYPSLTPRRQEVEYVVLAEADGTAATGLLENLRLIWRRKWLLLLPVVCIMPLIGLYVATQIPRYAATATVLIEDTNPKVLAIPEVMGPDHSPNFYSTQYEIIKSRAVAEEVVDTLHLDMAPPAPIPTPTMATLQAIKAFPGRILEAVLASMQAHDREIPSPTADWQRQQAIRRLLGALVVKPRKGINQTDTKLVDISVQGDDLGGVVRQTNAVAESYVRRNLGKRLEASRNATVWLHKEADTLRDKIAAGERRLHSLKEDKRLVASDASNAQAADLQRLSALNLSYLDKSRDRVVLRAELDELRKFLTSADLTQSAKYPTLLNNTTISGLRMRYIDLQIKMTELGKTFMDKHPKMVALAAEMAETRAAMIAEVQRVITSLENQYNALATQENNLKQLFNTQKSAVIRSDKDLTEFETLRRDLDIDKAMYLEVSKRLAETTITNALGTNNVTLVEAALVGSPVPSRAILYLLIGFIFSLGCGGGLALLAEGLSKRFKDVAEAEEALALPFLGFIPQHVLPKRRPPLLITLQEPWSVVAEAYHIVRTWIELAQPPVRSLLVTSALPGEGKSTTAANLAVSFAQLGRRVLLVDADLRRPSLHRVFGGIQSQGLTDVLVHGLEWQSVVHETLMENLNVLFAGPCPLSPSQLLSMVRLKHLIESWKAHFDLVIFDTPVALAIPDVMILAPAMDGAILVHSQRCSTRDMAVETKRLLERAGARLLGIILNHVHPKEKYYYSQRYGSKPSAAVTLWHPQQGIEDRDVAAPAIELRPTMGSFEAPPPASDPAPVVVGREGHSDGLHITLHTVLLRRHIGPQHAAAGTVFLTVDVEIANNGAFVHLFDPTLTALMAREETDYGRALASLIPIQGADDDADMFQTTMALGHYDAALTVHVDGLTAAVEIAPDVTSRENLVYRIPEASVSYTFVYTNPPIVLQIPFTLHI